MPVFRVQLNGKKVSTTGIGKRGVLTTIVNWVGHDEVGDFNLELVGLDTATDRHEHIRWGGSKLKAGDVVTIHIADDAAVDRPRTRKRMDPVKDLAAQKNYIKRMAKKFGWKIQEK